MAARFAAIFICRARVYPQRAAIDDQGDDAVAAEANPQTSLTIVSSMDDGPVDVPSLPNVKVLSGISWSELMRLMASSHFLLMPSWFESYGNVYIEAMSQGCVPLALDNPVQRELIGPYGILVSSQEPEEIRAALSQAMAARDTYQQKALAGLQNYKDKHAPEVIAQQFYSVLSGAKTGVRK